MRHTIVSWLQLCKSMPQSKSWNSLVSAISSLPGSVPGSRVSAGVLPGHAGSLQSQPPNRIMKVFAVQ